MPWARANKWDTEDAREIASSIAGIRGLYCGPAVVGWIAAVWNLRKGRSYDYMTRLKDKDLFPDGPRNFFGRPSALKGLSWQKSLNEILKRETEDDLKIADNTLHKYGSIHNELERHDLPLIIRMYPDMPGLHYVTLYKSFKDVRSMKFDTIKFFWQDNGLYGRKDGKNPGLYNTDDRAVGESQFAFGAQRVTKN